MTGNSQNYANHARFYPPFHYFVAPVLILNLLYTIWRSIQRPTLDTVWAVVLAAGLVGTATVARLMALTVQDRVIRLEMRIRLNEVLPSDLHSRIGELTPAQLIGLRFASDAELPELVRQVLVGSLRTTEGNQESREKLAGRLLARLKLRLMPGAFTR